MLTCLCAIILKSNYISKLENIFLGVIKRGTSGVRVSGVNISRISNQSHIIRKKPVMIQDISSSSPIASLGSMRSDEISRKTMVVTNQPKKIVGFVFFY